MIVESHAFACALHAVAPAISPEPHRRPWGVLVEPSPMHVLLVATDGHRVHLARVPAEALPDEPTFQIPPETVEALLKIFPLPRAAKKPRTEVPGSQKLAVTSNAITALGESGKGATWVDNGSKFPPWRRTIGNLKYEPCQEYVGVDAFYLSQAIKACEIFAGRIKSGPQYVVTEMHGPWDPVHVYPSTCIDSGLGKILGRLAFRAVVMPSRVDKQPFDPWLQ
jgi:hypothetical protein